MRTTTNQQKTRQRCSCGSTRITHDEAGGHSVCTSCGRVLEESVIKSEVSFLNHNATSQMVNFANSGVKPGVGFHSGSMDKSRTKARAYKQVEEHAKEMGLDWIVTERAKRIYDLAASESLGNMPGTDSLGGKFVKGRPTSFVVAAALYLACRYEKKPLLLIDFSDLCKVNLYILGAYYLKLVKYLHKGSEYDKIPQVDPSLFIRRFCQKLNFGDKMTQVSETALRFVQRFNRDWMCEGRRPTSICGAAILIAARYHGFTRTTSEIAEKLHVCEETLRKRVDEFKETKVAKLTREEFEKMDLNLDIQGEADPPAFTRNKKKTQELLKLMDENNLNNKQEGDNNNNTSNVNNKLMTLTNGEETLKGNTSANVGTDEKPLNTTGSQSKGNEQGLTQEVGGKELAKKEMEEEEEESDSLIGELDRDEEKEYLLSNEEQIFKSAIWHHINKDWLEEQERKEKVRAEKGITTQITPGKKAKKPREMTLIKCADPLTAVTQHSKISAKVNSEEARKLFDEPHPLKKAKYNDYDDDFRSYSQVNLYNQSTTGGDYDKGRDYDDDYGYDDGYYEDI